MEASAMRRPIVKALGFALLLVVGSTVLASMAAACSCQTATAQNVLAKSAVVFMGKVRTTGPAGPDAHRTTFIVTETFKGASLGEEIKVRHPSVSAASCGVRFAVDRSYTVRANRNPAGNLMTSLCDVWMFLPKVPSSQRLITELREAVEAEAVRK